MQAEPAENQNLPITSSIVDSSPAERDEPSFELVSDDTPTVTGKQPTLIKDPVYYMDTVVFKVQDHLFKVPTHYFMQKTSFFDPHFASLDAEKKIDDEKFIELEDVTPAEFRALLKFIYPIQTNRLQQVPPAPAPTPDEWITILKLSTRWMMLDVRRVAINALSSANIPLIDRVVLARECKVDFWLRSAYHELAKTASFMTQKDMDKIGLAAAFKIHKARERYMTTPNPFVKSRLFPPRKIPASSEKFDTVFQPQETTVKRSAVERVPLAREHGVAEWLREAFIELVDRREPLTVDESRTLGFDTVIRLCNARERRPTGRAGMSLALYKKTPVDQELSGELGALVAYQPVDRAVLARRYGVMEWLHQAFVELVERSEAISIPEAKALGYETAIRLAIARETYTMKNYNSDFGGKSDPYIGNNGNIGSIVDEELASELSAISSYGPVDRVLIARKAGFDEWLQSALNELVKRKEMVTDDEAAALGLDTCIQLCRFRLENLAGSSASWTDPGEIDAEFRVELSEVREAGERFIQPGTVMEEDEIQRTSITVGGAAKPSKGKKGKRNY